MNILLVGHGYPPECVGGTEYYLEAIARELAGEDSVTVFTGSLEWREQFEVVETNVDGVDVVRVHRSDLYFDHWDKLGNPHVARVYEDLLDRLAPDVVHVHHWIRLDHSLVRRAAARRIPVLVHLHDLFVTCPRVFRILDDDRFCNEQTGPDECRQCVPRWKFQGDGEIDRSLLHRRESLGAELEAAVAVLAPTESHAENCARLLPVERSRFEVVPHPDLPRTPRKPAVHAHSAQGRLIGSFASHLHPVKGLHVVLEAMREMGPRSGIALEVFGGFASEAYEAKVRALAEGLEVRFHGPYRAGEPGAVAADVVVVPSLAAESHSFWLDEALSSGLPVLVSDFGALAERADGRVTRVARADPAAWARALTQLRDDPALRATPGAPATRPESLEQHVERLRALYRSAAQRGAPAVPSPAAPRALEFDWDRREMAFRELLRSEDWEDVVADLRRELEERASKPS